MLRPLQGMFSPADYPDLLVGLSSPDDAAVWRLDGHRAIVVTTDFFTPVVDDPYDYGAIAAANSLSDVYAMGGQPFLALNVAGMPKSLPSDIIHEIIRGGAEKVKEAGVVIAGGHTVQDDEPKYGLVVIGFVDPQQTMMKSGVRVGDALVLTKPLGFGVTTTAVKQGQASDEDVAEVVGWMKQLNQGAANLARKYGLRGGTDITGFGLLGHAWELAQASEVGIQFWLAKVPFLACAQKFAGQWTFPGGTADNRAFFGPHVSFAPGIEEKDQMLMFDAQTSGGLLLAVPQGKLAALMQEAAEIGQSAWVVGEVQTGTGIVVLEQSPK